MPKEFDDMIEEIKITMKNESLNCILQPCYLIVWNVVKNAGGKLQNF